MIAGSKGCALNAMELIIMLSSLQQMLTVLRGLQSLDLSGSAIGIQSVQHLSYLQDLRSLNVASVPIAMEEIVVQHSQLTSLSLSHCR